MEKGFWAKEKAASLEFYVIGGLFGILDISFKSVACFAEWPSITIQKGSNYVKPVIVPALW